MKLLMRDFKNRNQALIFINLKQSVVDIFQGVNPKNFIYCQNTDELNDTLRRYGIHTFGQEVEHKDRLMKTRL